MTKAEKRLRRIALALRVLQTLAQLFIAGWAIYLTGKPTIGGVVLLSGMMLGLETRKWIKTWLKREEARARAESEH